MIYRYRFLLPALLLSIILNTSCVYIPGHAIYTDPLTAEEHNNLGVAYEKEGRLDLASKEYKKSIEMDNSLITPLINIGNIYLKQKKLDEAEKYYLIALGKDPHNINAANNLANVYIARNDDFQKGIDYLKDALENQEHPPPHVLDTLSDLYIKTGQLSEAGKILIELCVSIHTDKELYKSADSRLRMISGKGCN